MDFKLSDALSLSSLAVAVLTLFCPAFAGIEIGTQTPSLYADNPHNTASSLTLTVTGDDFAGASAEQPIYLRIELGQGAVLQHTLVDIEDPDNGRVHEPIFLPMRLVRGFTGDRIGAPPETLAIVRWIAGEDAIWLRIQSSSSAWIAYDGGTDAPSSLGPIAFDLGLPASTHWLVNETYLANSRANLQAPFRDIQATGESESFSTLICLDLQGGSLAADPAPTSDTRQTVEILPYDHQTTGITSGASEGDITLGALLSIDITGSMSVGRLRHATSAGSVGTSDANGTSTETCPENQDLDGLVSIDAQANLTFAGSAAWGFHRDSRLLARVPENAVYGFRVLLDDQDQPVDGASVSGRAGTVLLASSAFASNADTSQAFAPADALFDIQGVPFSRSAELRYQGAGVEGAFATSVSARLWSAEVSEDTTAEIGFAVRAAARDALIDPDSRFQGEHQHAWCGPQIARVVEDGLQGAGSFVACTNVTIADPVLRTLLLAVADHNEDGSIDQDEALTVTSLDISDAGVRDLGGLSGFANLETLRAAGNAISDLGELSELASLKEVVLTANRIESLAALVANGFLGTAADHAIAVDDNYLTAEVCADLDALQQRTTASGATLTFLHQGDRPFIAALAGWSERETSVLDMVTHQNDGAWLSPGYLLECL